MPDRHEYETGAVRSADCDDIRYDLITPIGLRALARTCAEGAEKFGASNWEKGMPVTDLLNHAIAHIYNFLAGDRSEDHLGHAAWNVLGAIHSYELWPELNNGTLRGTNCSAPGNTAVPPIGPVPDNGNADLDGQLRELFAAMAMAAAEAKTAGN